MYAEEEDGDNSAAAQHSLENSITMNKMKLLKAKMEDMNLNKKVGELLGSHLDQFSPFPPIRMQMRP